MWLHRLCYRTVITFIYSLRPLCLNRSLTRTGSSKGHEQLKCHVSHVIAQGKIHSVQPPSQDTKLELFAKRPVKPGQMGYQEKSSVHHTFCADNYINVHTFISIMYFMILSPCVFVYLSNSIIWVYGFLIYIWIHFYHTGVIWFRNLKFHKGNVTTLYLPNTWPFSWICFYNIIPCLKNHSS